MEGLSSVDRALDVLFHLHRERGSRGVSDIGRALGLPKSSIHRLLQTLSRRWLVERDGSGRYRTGVGLLALGLGALRREPLIAAARPVLEQEASSVGETVFLVSARAGALVVLDKVEGTGFLRASPEVGSHVPVHVTAVGKLYLALAPQLIDTTSETPTAARSTLGTTLREQVEWTRARGYGVNTGESIEGLSVVAAPVVSGDELLGAVAVAAPAARMAAFGVERMGRRCVAAARRVAATLEGERS